MFPQAPESMTVVLVLPVGAGLGFVVHLLLNEDRGTLKLAVLLGAGSLLWLHHILVYGPLLEAERLRGLRRDKGAQADPTESSRYSS